jgi:PPOX class probable F420-dependent enzyme
MSEIPPFAAQARELTLREYIIWFTTTSRDLTPIARPVWFVWWQGAFLIFSRPESHKVRHIRERPNVSLHFNSDFRAANDVVIFKGVARIDPDVPSAHQIATYVEKYVKGIAGLGKTPVQFSAEYSAAIRVEVVDLQGL